MDKKKIQTQKKWRSLGKGKGKKYARVALEAENNTKAKKTCDEINKITGA